MQAKVDSIVATGIGWIAALAAALGVTWGIFVGGFIGALLSLFPNNPEHTFGKKVSKVIGGTSLAAVAAPQTGVWFSLEPLAQAGIAVVGGLFGLIIVVELAQFLKDGGVRQIINQILRLKGADK